MKNQSIKILDIRENPGMGGINAGLFKLHNEINKRNEIKVVYAVLTKDVAGWLFTKAERVGLSVIPLQYKNPLDFSVLWRIKKLILEEGINIIHTRGYRANFLIRLMLDLKLVDLPHVITKHGMPVLHRKRNYVYSYLDQRPTRLADKVVAVDNGTYMKLLVWKTPKSKLCVIPNAVIPIEGSYKIDKNLIDEKLVSNSQIVGLFLGRVERAKGVFELIEAHSLLIKKGYRIHNLIVGDGVDKETLRECVNKNNIPNVSFIETQLDVAPYLSACDFVVLPSYSEGLPNVLLEAMASSRAIIASNVGGIPDLLKPGENGLLVPPKNADELANAMEYLILNPKVCVRMGQCGKEMTSTIFSPQNVVDEYIKLYRDVMNN